MKKNFCKRLFRRRQSTFIFSAGTAEQEIYDGKYTKVDTLDLAEDKFLLKDEDIVLVTLPCLKGEE